MKTKRENYHGDMRISTHALHVGIQIISFMNSGAHAKMYKNNSTIQGSSHPTASLSQQRGVLYSNFILTRRPTDPLTHIRSHQIPTLSKPLRIASHCDLLTPMCYTSLKYSFVSPLMTRRKQCQCGFHHVSLHWHCI